MLKVAKKNKLQYVLPALSLAVCCAIAFMPAAASGIDNAYSTIETILQMLCGIVGAVFLIVGVVKFAIAHANEDGPAQQKAILMLATGAILLVLSALIGTGTLSLSSLYSI